MAELDKAALKSKKSKGVQALVDVLEHEVPVLIGDLVERALHPGFGGADAAALAQGDGENNRPSSAKKVRIR